MNKISMLTRSICILYIMVSAVASAEVIFSDNFDAQPDWNSSMDASQLLKWDEKMAENRGGQYEASYISSDGAYGGQGKGFIQYWDEASGYSYAQDNWLMKNNVNFPNEWYLGYWFQHDPEWDWGSVGSLKLLKVHFNTGATWDIYATNFCAACPDWQVPSGSGYSWCTDDAGRNWAGSWNALNGEWHYFVWRFNHSAGTISLTIDGVNAMETNYQTDYPGSGWDSEYGISFGGNISNGGGGKNEMWTKYDNIIIATTVQEVEDFLNADGGVTSPAPVSVPSGFQLD